MKSCKLHRVTIGLSASFGLMLSIFSDIDCRFVHVDIGFKPDNAIYRSKEFGLGLWSMEDPTAPEECLMIDISQRIGSITRGDHYYSSSFLNGDVIWGVARILALSGLVFGLINVIIIWRLILSIDYSKKARKEFILYISLIFFMCEGIKFGLFLNIKPCTAEIWEQNSTIPSDTMVVERYEADQCRLGRSAYASLCAFLCYVIVLIYLTASLVKPDYTHEVSRLQRYGVNTLAFDEVSMPSYLGSIGASVASGSTRTSGSTRISSNTQGSESTYHSVSQMAPIVEERSCKSDKFSNSSPNSKSNIYTICSSDDDSSGEDSFGDDSSGDLFDVAFDSDRDKYRSKHSYLGTED